MIRYAYLIIFTVVFTTSHPVGKNQKDFDLYQATCEAVFMYANRDCNDVTYRKTHRGCKLYCTCDGSYEEYYSNDNFESCGKRKVCYEGECQKIVYSGRYDSLTDGEVSDSVAITGKENPCKIIYFNNATKTELFQDSYPNGKECYDSESGEKGKCNSGVCTPLKYFGSQESESIETIYSIEDDVDFESEEFFSSSGEFEDEYLVYISPNEERVEDIQNIAPSEGQNLNTLDEDPQEKSFRENIDERMVTIKPGVTQSQVNYVKKDDKGEKISDKNKHEDEKNRDDKNTNDIDDDERIKNEGKDNSNSFLKAHGKGEVEKLHERKYGSERSSQGKCICGPATSTEPNEKIKVTNVDTKEKSKETKKDLKENQNKSHIDKSGKITTKNSSNLDETGVKDGRGENVQERENKNVNKSKKGSKQKTSDKPGTTDKPIIQNYTEKPSKSKSTKEIVDKVKNNSKDKDLESNKSIGINENVTDPTNATLKKREKDDTSGNTASNREKYTATTDPTIIKATLINKASEITTKGTSDSTNKVTGMNQVKEMVSKKDKSGEKVSRKEGKGKSNESKTTVVYSLDKSTKKYIIPSKTPNTKDKKSDLKTNDRKSTMTDKDSVKDGKTSESKESMRTNKKGLRENTGETDSGNKMSDIQYPATEDTGGNKIKSKDLRKVTSYMTTDINIKKKGKDKKTDEEKTIKGKITETKDKSGEKDNRDKGAIRTDQGKTTKDKITETKDDKDKGAIKNLATEESFGKKDAVGKTDGKKEKILKHTTKKDVKNEKTEKGSSNKVEEKDRVTDAPKKKGPATKVTGKSVTDKNVPKVSAVEKAVRKDVTTAKIDGKDSLANKVDKHRTTDKPLGKDGVTDAEKRKISPSGKDGKKDSLSGASEKKGNANKMTELKAGKKDGVPDKLTGKDVVSDTPLKKGAGDEVTEEKGANSEVATGKAVDKDAVTHKAVKKDGVTDKDTVSDTPLKKGSGDEVTEEKGANSEVATGKAVDKDAVTHKAVKKDGVTDKDTVSDTPLKKATGDEVTGENGANSEDATIKVADKNAVTHKAVRKDGVKDILTRKDTVPDTPLKKATGDEVTGENGANSEDAIGNAVDSKTDKTGKKYVSDSQSGNNSVGQIADSSAVSNGGKNDSKGSFVKSLSRDGYLEASETNSSKVFEEKISSKA